MIATRWILGPLLALACGASVPTQTLTIAGTRLEVEIADDNQERAKGLMHRDSLAADRGMLFIYPEEDVRRFWMKDTRIPLSIAFLDEDGTILRIADMNPLDTNRTSSNYKVRYALEVNQGWFAEHGIEKGAVVEGIPK